jgi:hypothetical protein
MEKMNISAYNYQQYDLETDLEKYHLLLHHNHPSHLNLKQQVHKEQDLKHTQLCNHQYYYQLYLEDLLLGN